jgi:hypothetical protein
MPQRRSALALRWLEHGFGLRHDDDRLGDIIGSVRTAATSEDAIERRVALVHPPACGRR